MSARVLELVAEAFEDEGRRHRRRSGWWTAYLLLMVVAAVYNLHTHAAGMYVLFALLGIALGAGMRSWFRFAAGVCEQQARRVRILEAAQQVKP